MSRGKILEMHLSENSYYSGSNVKHRAIIAFVLSAFLLLIFSGLLYSNGAPVSLIWGIIGLIVMIGLFLVAVFYAFSHMSH